MAINWQKYIFRENSTYSSLSRYIYIANSVLRIYTVLYNDIHYIWIKKFAPIWIRIRAVWHVTLPVCINFKNLFLKIWKPKNLIFWQKFIFWNGRKFGNIMMHFFQVSRVSFHVSIVWARIHKSCWIKKDPIWIRIHKFTTLSNRFQFVIFEHLPV